ncbi:MAG TPA: RNase A-like domain-containing protein [Bryobacteraceae bacterium]|nr:RNase A-like domain-containing protein [Bryobacteraceae bacterium]
MADEGLTLVLTPAQLALVLQGQDVNSTEHRTNRLWAGLGVIGGTLELVGAGALLLTPEPTMATKAGGLVLGAHGVDTVSTNFWQMWTGKKQRTLTDQSAAALARALGADPATADKIGTGVDIAVPLVVSLGVGAARLAAVRAGRLSLIEHEAAAGSKVGGHTILKHIGKTEAELRARLLAEGGIPAASTFESLEIAEKTLYQGLKTNRTAIEAWAKTAAPGARKAFFYNAPGAVGQGVVRASNQLVKMSKVRFVLKMEAFQGKLYYILTAFPEP